MAALTLDGRTFDISNPDKLLFPEAGILKRDLVQYYERIASTMLPYVRGRPLTMERYPEGLSEEGFYHKEVPDHFPDWIERVTIPLKSEDGVQTQTVCNSPATLVYIVNQGCVTPHVWLSRRDKLDFPDRLIFDLDPPNGEFDAVVFAAQVLHELLDELKLRCYVMTTGSRGLHVAVPLERSMRFDDVREFAQEAAQLLAEEHPQRLTVEHRKDRRGDRVYLDTLRNSYGQTSVPPYAVRARPGAPVTMPLSWTELERPGLRSDSYRIENAFRRLGQVGDRWQGKISRGQSLAGKLEALRSLTSI